MSPVLHVVILEIGRQTMFLSRVKICGESWQKPWLNMEDWYLLCNALFHCRMGNELQEARSSEDDLEHPPTKKNKRDMTEDSNGKLMICIKKLNNTK